MADKKVIEPKDYLMECKTTLAKNKKDWDFFVREVPQKFMSLVRSGIKPTISRGPSAPGQLSVSLNFESNMDVAKRYIERVKDDIEKKSQCVFDKIAEMDKKLDEFVEKGIDSETFSELVKHINEWIEYIPKMKLEIHNKKVEIETPANVKAIGEKWDKVSKEEIRKKEAEKYGVPIDDLDKHKKYLDAKSKKSIGKTSADVKNARKIFASLNGYMDSSTLIAACDQKIKELEIKEKEEERIKKELEEEKKRAEAEKKSS